VYVFEVWLHSSYSGTAELTRGQNLIKITPSNHRDYANLVTALEKVPAIFFFCNLIFFVLHTYIYIF
jgi:hypothetical protein